MEGVFLALEWIFRGIAALGPVGEAMIKAFTGGQSVEAALAAMRKAYEALRDSPDLDDRFKVSLDKALDGLPDDEHPDDEEELA